MKETLLTINEVLKIAGISRNTLYRDIASGKIKVIKFGKNTRFKKSDVDAYAKNKKDSKRVQVWKEKKNTTQHKI